MNPVDEVLEAEETVDLEQLMTTGEAIEDLRRRVAEEGGTQTEFAMYLGISVQYLNDVLLYKGKPSKLLGYERVTMWRRMA